MQLPANVFNVTGLGQVQVQTSPCPPDYCTGGAYLQLNSSIALPQLLAQMDAFASAQSIPLTSSGQVEIMSAAASSSPPSSSLGCGPSRQSSPDNPLCADCVSGYVEWQGSCQPCPGTKWDLVTVLVLATFAYVLGLVWLSASPGSAFKILVYFVQTAVFQLGSVESLLAWLNVVNFAPTQATGSTCVTPLTPYESLGMGIVEPLLLYVELLVLVAAHLAMFEVLRKWPPSSSRLRSLLIRLLAASPPPRANNSQHGEVQPWPDATGSGTCVEDNELQYQQQGSTSVKKEANSALGAADAASTLSAAPVTSSATSLIFPRHVWVRTSVVLYLFAYQQITQTCLQFLQCDDVAGFSVVFTQPGIDCSSTTYQRWRTLALTVLVLDVLLSPLCIGVFLYRKRQLILQSGPCRDSQHEAAVQRFRSHFGNLYSGFAPHAYLLQPLLLVRQVVLVMLDVLLQQWVNYRYLAFTLFNLACLCGHVALLPNTLRHENWLEAASYALLTLFTAILETQPIPRSAAMQVVNFIIIVPFAVLLLTIIVHTHYDPIGRLRHKLHERLRGESKDALAGQTPLKTRIIMAERRSPLQSAHFKQPAAVSAPVVAASVRKAAANAGSAVRAERSESSKVSVSAKANTS
jgi:hypothetical protein